MNKVKLVFLYLTLAVSVGAEEPEFDLNWVPSKVLGYSILEVTGCGHILRFRIKNKDIPKNRDVLPASIWKEISRVCKWD